MSTESKVSGAVTDALTCCDAPDPYVQIVEWNHSKNHFNVDGYCQNCHTSFGGHAGLADFEVTR